ncbi:MAG: hypothetical protein OJF48_003114 [Afipia sp.]|jgi:hypothetical protein|nr:MAG: hypothetical protein OJF48_003114 [Afipia sp.]
MRELFYRAFEMFMARERENLLNNVSERNSCFRLGLYLEEERKTRSLTAYYVDAEYNRQQDGQIKAIIDNESRVVNITCDLILHSRGQIVEADNLIALEMKKSDRPEKEKEKDRVRLRALTKESYDGLWSNDGITLPEYVCGYAFGAFIELNAPNALITVEEYERGNMVSRRNFNLSRPALGAGVTS